MRESGQQHSRGVEEGQSSSIDAQSLPPLKLNATWSSLYAQAVSPCDLPLLLNRGRWLSSLPLNSPIVGDSLINDAQRILDLLSQWCWLLGKLVHGSSVGQAEVAAVGRLLVEMPRHAGKGGNAEGRCRRVER